MKVINLKLYQFKELDRKAKENALNLYRDINVNFNWWESVYEDFIWLCACMGIKVDFNTIYFNDFYSQGAGSCFSAQVDLFKLDTAIQISGWKQYAPDTEFPFKPLDVNRRVLALIKSGALNGDTKILARTRNYSVTVDLGFYVEMRPGREHVRIFDELDKMEAWLNGIALRLNQHLFSLLRSQYEFLTSDTAIIESELFNEWLFTADGRTANHLVELNKRKSQN